MTDDLNAKARGIVEGAIAQLVEMGMDRCGALSLLALQSIIRMGGDDMPWDKQLEAFETLRNEIDATEAMLRDPDEDGAKH